MRYDLSRAVTLICAVLDDDDPDATLKAILQAEPFQLCVELMQLCVELGRRAYGDDTTLRDVLRDALASTVTSQDEQP